MSNKIKCSHILVAKQSEALEILEKIKGSQNINLLLDKEAGHRLSEQNQLNRIIDIIKRTIEDI